MIIKAHNSNVKTASSIICLIFLLSLFCSIAHSQTYTKDTSSTILLDINKPSPLQILLNDSLANTTTDNKYIPMPGAKDVHSSPLQDSNFARAIRLSIPHSARLANDLRMFSPLIPTKSDKINRAQSIYNALDLPSEVFRPVPVELTNYQYGIMMSQNSVTGINTYNPFGLKMPISSITGFLGLSEDVSPIIQYTLEYPVQVQVLVYSVNATVVATIFEGRQTAGKYTYTWNGRDDAGKPMPRGDYIAEVRIGNEKFLRKRIVIP